jgi:outer membrane lipoprotein-sorting protein
MARELLDRETESAKKGLGSEITRANYDFVFLRQENFGVVPEYVLRIVPKRKDKYLLRGRIWVDASTFRIRRIEGVPAKRSRAFSSHCNIPKIGQEEAATCRARAPD